MNPISIAVIGRLGDAPRTFTTRNGTTGVELRLAIDVPSRIPGGEGITRWVKVTAYGPLAERTAASVGKGDRVTVLADDLIAEGWAATGWGEPRARVTLAAREIAASMAFDTLRTGHAARKALATGPPGPQRAAAASATAAAGRRVRVEGRPVAWPGARGSGVCRPRRSWPAREPVRESLPGPGPRP